MRFESFKVPAWRLYTLAGLLVGMLCVLGVSLGYRQLTHGGDYAERERLQNLRRILLPAPRGRILDREGRVLVENKPSWRVVLYLAELRRDFNLRYRQRLRTLRAQGTNPPADFDVQVRAEVVQDLVNTVNSLTGRAERVNAQALERHFRQRLLLPFPVVEDLSAQEFAVLLERLPPGSPLQLSASSYRHYPHGALAAHTLGYVNAAEVTLGDDEFGENLATFAYRGSRGAAGLEQAFEDRLQGTPGGEIWMVDHQGRQYKLVQSRAPKHGEDLVTSLDLDLQQVAEESLIGKTGAVVALNVRTGEVLTLATSPGYDANAFEHNRGAEIARMTEAGAWLNRGLQGLYPPGSTFKMITALASMRAGLLDGSTTHVCEGVHLVGGRLFPCHARFAHGEIGLVEALRASCNVFFYKEGLGVGADAIAAEARRFGLGEPTGIELPAETHRMLVPDRAWKRKVLDESWFAGDTANYSIGQGFLRVTPLQMCDFVAALARGETRTRPTILKLSAEDARKTRPGGGRIDLQPMSLALLKDGMELAVQRGTARYAQIPGLRIAGKTGTAQVEAPGGTLNMAWFVGFAPIEAPEIAVAVLIEGQELDVEFAGGRQAAPAARAVLERYFDKKPAEEAPR